MNKLLMAFAASAIVATPALADDDDWGNRGRGYGHYKHDRDYRDYRKNRDYREDRRYYGQGYREGYRTARADSRDYWRSSNGRYYTDYANCRRDSNTEGTVIGAVAGGVLGNIIAPDGSKTLGSVIGGTLGAVLGREVDKNDNVRRCY